MNISISRQPSIAIFVEFNEDDLTLAFPCDAHDAELFYRLLHSCNRSISEELETFAEVARLIEAATPPPEATVFLNADVAPEILK